MIKKKMLLKLLSTRVPLLDIFTTSSTQNSQEPVGPPPCPDF